MSPKAEKVLLEALELSEAERAALAASLIESLDREVDEDAEAAWSAEIARRIAELESGTVKSVPWPEARRMILSNSDESSKP
jgi:putative addiction module component (TIGR02574 family)